MKTAIYPIFKTFCMMGLLLIGSPSNGQSYPAKPISFIVPFAPGAGVDGSARAVARKLSENISQQVVVHNRPGGNTIIGTEAAARAAPDGYTLLVTNTAIVTTPLLSPTSYDPIRDFEAVATTTSSDLFLVANAKMSASTIKELVALAKSKPGELNYGSSGGGSTTHLAMELFCKMTGIRMQHVSYKGGSQVMADLLGGQIQLLFASPFTAVTLIKSGKVKAIGYTDTVRWPSLPQVQTFSELGLPDYSFKAWHGILAPKGTQRAIVEKISSDVQRSLATSEAKEQLAAQGLDVFYSNSTQFQALMKAETTKLGQLIRDANVKLE